MPQVFLPPENIQGKSFFLDKREVHHVGRVLRKKTGDEILLFDGKGKRYKGKLTAVNLEESSIQGTILEDLSQAPPKTKLALYQGLPRGSKFDYVIEKAAELNAAEIIPFLSEKNPLGNSGAKQNKVDRWRRVSEAAAKQCGRSTLPAVSTVKSFSELLLLLAESFPLLFSVASDSQPIQSVLKPLVDETPLKIGIIVGPESGFSAKEMTSLLTAGCRPVSLGNSVLRTETAGLVALSLVNYELGLL